MTWMSEMAGVEWIQEPLFDLGEIVHACPLSGEQITLCCGKTPFDLSRTDRLTLDPALVTCPSVEEKNWCDPCEGWIDGQPCDP